MKQLNSKAKIYILGTVLAGAILLVRALALYQFEGTWLMLALSGLATLALLFKVEGSTNRSHYNVSFLVYAFSFLELGPEKTLLVIVFSSLGEWAFNKYPWFIVCFNAFSLSVVFTIAELVHSQLQLVFPPAEISHVATVFLALVVVTLANHLMVGLVIWFARNENITESGVFEFFPLVLDLSLLCMGIGMAMIWKLNPFAVILTLMPLYLIYSTLKVPALERKTEIDSKTGIYNAGFLNQALENELKRSVRFKRSLTVIMADMDLLRNINNTYGHLAGDEVLIGVAKILKESVREYDVVARFGGEEFVIMLPEISADEAFKQVEAIRENIERAEFTVQTSVTPIKVTMSFGIAGREGDEQTVKDLLSNADAALYHAKIKGRNRVIIYSESGYQNLFEPAGRARVSEEPARRNPDLAVSPDQALMPAARAADLAEPALKATIQKPAQENAGKSSRPAKALMSASQYVGILLAAALVLFGVIAPYSMTPDWLGLALFALLVGGMEWLSIDIYVRDTSVSTSAAPLLAGFLLYGPVGVAILSLSLACVAMIKHRSRIRSFIFNTSNQMIAGLLCSGAMILIGGSFTDLPIWQQVLGSLVGAGVIYGSTTLMVAIGMSLDQGPSIREIWMEKFSWLGVYYQGMGLIAFVLLICFKNFGPTGMLVILGPLLLLRLGQMQYIDKTRTVVNELREKNLALEKSADEIHKLNEGLLNTLAEVVELRDPFVLGHSRQVARIAELLAIKMGLSYRQALLIHKAGLLHDIGKLGIPEVILSKPGKLTHQEYSIIQKHASVGADILKSSYSLHDLIPVVYQHHEHFDGSGYPQGLKGPETTIEARIVAVADAVDAMASDRPYRGGQKLDAITSELLRCSGSQFDPQVVQAFVELAQERGERLISAVQKVDFVEK